MSIIEVQLGAKDRERLGIGDTVLTVDEDTILDATFEDVHAWEQAWDVSLHYLMHVDVQARTARAKRVLAFLACQQSGIEVGTYKAFTIQPNRCRLVEREAAADVVPPADSSATSSEGSPSEIG